MPSADQIVPFHFAMLFAGTPATEKKFPAMYTFPLPSVTTAFTPPKPLVPSSHANRSSQSTSAGSSMVENGAGTGAVASVATTGPGMVTAMATMSNMLGMQRTAARMIHLRDG